MLETRILIFIETAQRESIGQTARAMNLSQDQVRSTIEELEAEMNCQLFSEYRGQLRLTRMGEKYYHGCKRIQEMISDLKEEMNFVPVPQIRIGFSGTRDNQGLIEFISTYKRKNPSINFTFTKGEAHENIDRLYQDDIDICFGLKNSCQNDPDLWVVELFDYDVCVIMPKNHPLAARADLCPEDLDGENLVFCGRQNGQPFYYHPLDACDLVRQGPQSHCEVRTFDELLSMVCNEEGLGIISQESVESRRLEELGLRVSCFENSYCAMVRAGENRQEVLEFLREAKQYFASQRPLSHPESFSLPQCLAFADADDQAPSSDNRREDHQNESAK